MRKLKVISMTLVLMLSIVCLFPLSKSVKAADLQPNYIPVCRVYGNSHYGTKKVATQAVIKETGEFLYLVRERCDCGTYLWYEGYPSWGITRYFYGTPDFMEADVDYLNRTVYKISSSSIYYGNPPNWVFY